LFERAGWVLPPEIDPENPISGFEDDSRAVQPGFVFIAVQGEAVDGHRFIAQTLRAGAALVVAQRIPEEVDASLIGLTEFPAVSLCDLRAERGVPRAVGRILLVEDTRAVLGPLAQAYWGNPSRRLQVIGVTGTNGKTTTTYLVESALCNLRRFPALFGTIEYRLGGQSSEAPNTTPGALDLARMMALALDRDADSVVMEVSSHALVQKRVEGIQFAAAALTNITQDHLDFHHTMEEYAEAKRLLFTHCKPRVAVFNLDDPVARRFAAEYEGAKITFGLNREYDPDIYPETLESSQTGMRLSLSIRCKGTRKTVAIVTPLQGSFNASNLLTAAGLCAALGLAPEQIAACLAGVKGAPGRLEPILLGQPFKIFVDYAHTPDAVERLLENIRPLTAKRVIAILGCGGDRDPGKRPKMGAAMGRLADYSIISTDNPRTEDPARIAAAVEEGVQSTAKSGAYEVCLDRREAIRRALTMAGPGDTVVIAGKGHETYQEVQGERHHFDDRETARELLRELNRV
jgi:UDP-N-acetylmuramoyl-L-alanyl-D-glutamate--2,6-diaminopimelate ligase